ncbi:MAG: ParB/RepB/Spo0J family partition protein [Candidatus Aminicenantales bacterium]
MKRKALGKGLKAFIPEDYGILKEERYAELSIELIQSNPHQPRLHFDQKAIDELAESIRKTGLLQPVIVTPEGEFYRIIVGERRWRAAKKAGLVKIPVIIRSIEREKQLEVSLIENIQREELNPLEIALAYQKLIKELNYTHQELAEKVGKDRASITNYLRLLKLPTEIQNALAENKITMGHARALITLDDPQLQTSICRQIIRNNLSVRDVEKLISRAKPKKRPEKLPHPDLVALEERMVKLLGTKVSISGHQNRGVVKIYYYSVDELNRIYEQMKGEAR